MEQLLQSLLNNLGVTVAANVIISGVKSLFSKKPNPTPADIKSEILSIVGSDNNNAVEKIYNFVQSHNINGENNIVMGNVNITNGGGNINIGTGNEITGSGSIVIGHGNKIN